MRARIALPWPWSLAAPAVSRADRAGWLPALALLASLCRPAFAVPHYELAVALDPGTRLLQVAGTIAIEPGRSLEVRLDPRFRVQRLDVEG
jgi:hypothetical protein